MVCCSSSAHIAPPVAFRACRCNDLDTVRDRITDFSCVFVSYFCVLKFSWSLISSFCAVSRPLFVARPASQFLVPGSWFSVPGSQFSVLGSRFSVPGSRFLVLSSQFSVPGSRFLVPGSQFLVLSSWFSVPGSQFSVLGSQFLVLGSRFSVLGSWFLVLSQRTMQSSMPLLVQ
jgi:hypothetical protein